jgi:predicted transcriptional regulator
MKITDKQLALESIQRMSDDASLADIAERVRFLAGVQEGLDAADRGEVISHDEVKRQLANWLRQ